MKIVNTSDFIPARDDEGLAAFRVVRGTSPASLGRRATRLVDAKFMVVVYYLFVSTI